MHRFTVAKDSKDGSFTIVLDEDAYAVGEHLEDYDAHVIAHVDLSGKHHMCHGQANDVMERLLALDIENPIILDCLRAIFEVGFKTGQRVAQQDVRDRLGLGT